MSENIEDRILHIIKIVAWTMIRLEGITRITCIDDIKSKPEFDLYIVFKFIRFCDFFF